MSLHNDSSNEGGPLGSSPLVLALREARSNASSEFERHYANAVPTIVAWTRLRIAGLPHGRIDVEDVLQETWVRALEAFSRFDQSASFRSWVIGIAQNVLLEALRSDGRRTHRNRLEGDPALSQYPDSVTSVSRAAARDDGLVRLLELISGLSSEDRQLVLMHGLEERPLAQVAERLELSEEAATKRWQRLCARLREQPAFASIWEG
jgi:RNA polymerase sigma-70 factor (ECF subfamily)